MLLEVQHAPPPLQPDEVNRGTSIAIRNKTTVSGGRAGEKAERGGGKGGGEGGGGIGGCLVGGGKVERQVEGW